MSVTLERALEGFAASQSAMNSRIEKMLEHWCDVGNLIDPREPYTGPDGEPWIAVGGQTGGNDHTAIYRNESELERVRALGRYFADENEFAINSHENRISYLIGWGHTYNAVAKKGEEVSQEDLQAVRDVIEEFLRANRWSPSYVSGQQQHQSSGRSAFGYRQEQNVYRRDRDGEVFLRKFRDDDGILKVRYIEPEHVFTPHHLSANPHVQYGIETDPNDIEQVINYHVAGSPVPANEVQHRTRGGSPRHPRGVALHYAVRKNLIRAGKILRNGSTVTEIQVSIAMIRKHMQASAATVQAFQQSITQASRPQQPQGPGERRQKFGPGTILDAPAGIDYELPVSGIDPEKYVSALQADLRAVAARLVMPEFMLTSDASNSNFASTMVAEGPAVKNFERLQWDEISFDLELIWNALWYAVESGRLSADVLQRIDVNAEPPTVNVRNRIEDAQVAQVLDSLGWISPQTGSSEFGLDYEQEQQNREEHQERHGIPLSGDRPQLPPIPGEEEEDEEDGQYDSEQT